MLKIILTDGPVPAKEVEAQAKDAGVSERTLMRAKGKLAIQASRDGFGKGSAWIWELPKDANSPIPKMLASFDRPWHSSYIDAET